MALERILLVFHSPTAQQAEETAPIYLLRLSAFVMILFAIWDKKEQLFALQNRTYNSEHIPCVQGEPVVHAAKSG